MDYRRAATVLEQQRINSKAHTNENPYKLSSKAKWSRNFRDDHSRPTMSRSYTASDSQIRSLR